MELRGPERWPALPSISLKLRSISALRGWAQRCIAVEVRKIRWMITAYFLLPEITEVTACMNFGTRRTSNSESPGEVARLAQLPGTDRADLVRGAVQALLAAPEVDRAGIRIDEGDL